MNSKDIVSHSREWVMIPDDAPEFMKEHPIFIQAVHRNIPFNSYHQQHSICFHNIILFDTEALTGIPECFPKPYGNRRYAYFKVDAIQTLYFKDPLAGQEFIRNVMKSKKEWLHPWDTKFIDLLLIYICVKQLMPKEELNSMYMLKKLGEQ